MSSHPSMIGSPGSAISSSSGTCSLTANTFTRVFAGASPFARRRLFSAVYCFIRVSAPSGAFKDLVKSILTSPEFENFPNRVSGALPRLPSAALSERFSLYLSASSFTYSTPDVSLASKGIQVKSLESGINLTSVFKSSSCSFVTGGTKSSPPIPDTATFFSTTTSYSASGTSSFASTTSCSSCDESSDASSGTNSDSVTSSCSYSSSLNLMTCGSST